MNRGTVRERAGVTWFRGALWQSLADETEEDSREQAPALQIRGAQTACFRIHLNY